MKLLTLHDHGYKCVQERKIFFLSLLYVIPKVLVLLVVHFLIIQIKEIVTLFVFHSYCCELSNKH